MKLEKLLSITIINSLVLLLFGVIIASCDKPAFYKTGELFTWDNNEITRSPASSTSLSVETERFIKFQDPVQVLLFCYNNSKRPQACYQEELAKSLQRFSAAQENLVGLDLNTIKDELSFALVETRFKQQVDQIYGSLQQEFKELVSKRKEFCHQNSIKYLDKCLHQYVEKDTFSILNKFQSSKQKRLNGHEYLHLKSVIRDKLKDDLDKAQLSMEKEAAKKSI